ncbi:MAG TPA: YajQ family cyclic di-GMP-binding protein [Candidatus Saccharimonadales bacterium]|nr:YajQ family cyclic di-GMP-binding protein [Candidatus Saccharimonadales bacterium]
MANYSFDIVSDYDRAELNNVFDQTKREMLSRYDFKGTSAALEWGDPDKASFKVTGDSQMQIDAIIDIIRKKLAARNQSQKLLDTSGEIQESNMKSTMIVPFKKGLNPDKAKPITKLIQTAGLKVKTQIQGEVIRVTGSSKDDLQSVMSLVRAQDYDFPLSFTNYR